MKRRVIEMLNLQEDSFSNRETKEQCVDWENKNVSYGQETFDQKQGGFDMKHKLPDKLTIQSKYLFALKILNDKGWKINLNERKKSINFHIITMRLFPPISQESGRRQDYEFN